MSEALKPSIPEGPFVVQLAGMPEAQQWALGLVADIKQYQAGKLPWKEIDAGCLLHGPPGTGKTTLARAIAASAALPLIVTSYAEWTRQGPYGNDLIRALRQVFDNAIRNAPCVVAIDEIDSVPSRSNLDGNQVVSVNTVNALLAQFDELKRREGVIVVATCNHPERLDPALTRPGRLGRSISIPLPSIDAIPQILAFHLKRHASCVDLNAIAVMCAGMSPAEIEQIVTDARRAARRAQQQIHLAHFVSVLRSSLKGMGSEDIYRLAVHEAGHAVVTRRVFPAVSVTASIIGRGFCEQLAFATAPPRTRSGVLDMLSVLLAGRAAEGVILGEPSGRCGGTETSDLAAASQMAMQAVGSQGLSGCGSLTWWPDAASAKLPAQLYDQVQSMLKEAHRSAETLISREKVFLEACAIALYDRYALTAEALTALDPTHPRCDAWRGPLPPPLPGAR